MTSERPLTEEEQYELEQYANSGRQMLSVADDAAPVTIVGALDRFVDAWPRRAPAQVSAELLQDQEMIDRSWSLGALLGNQINREFAWLWTVAIKDGVERYGVVSNDRALVLYPAYFIRECLYDAGRDFTAMLMFNMLLGGRFSSFSPDGFVDLSETITRIVPRR